MLAPGWPILLLASIVRTSATPTATPASAHAHSLPSPSTHASTFRLRAAGRQFLRSDRNVKLYSLQQVLERKFLEPEDYVTNEKEIIWSHESRQNERGKWALLTVNEDRVAAYSLKMTFLILGSVIAFIIVVYFNHILMLKRLREEERRDRLRRLMERSLALLASSGQQVPGFENVRLERKSSLLNAFRHFRL